MIRLTKQTDYGIVLLTVMAQQQDVRLNAPELAAETLLPQPMVSKILKTLSRAGLLTSLRGAKGGYLLAKSPSEISVAEIIAAIEGPIALTECIEEGPDECSFEASCQVRGHWQTINEAVKQALESVRLVDMATSPPALSLPGRKLVTLGR